MLMAYDENLIEIDCEKDMMEFHKARYVIIEEREDAVKLDKYIQLWEDTDYIMGRLASVIYNVYAIVKTRKAKSFLCDINFIKNNNPNIDFSDYTIKCVNPPYPHIWVYYPPTKDWMLMGDMGHDNDNSL